MRNFARFLAMVILFAVLTACGGGTETKYVYMQTAQSVVSEGDFYIDVANKTQKVVLKLDEQGFIHQGLQGIGSMKYKTTDVQSVLYESERQNIEVLPVENPAEKSVSMSFVGVVNNDKPRILFTMKDGEVYQLETRALTLHASEEIRFMSAEWGFVYGHSEQTNINVVRNSDDTININIFWGCDKLVGLTSDNIELSSIGGVAWELEDGTLYTATILQNAYGSFYANVIGVPMTQENSQNYWQGSSTTGRLVIFSKDGTRIPFKGYNDNFEWNYDYKYPELSYETPYWDIPGKESIMRFYIPIQS
jgi:hypothetical protein